VLNVTLSSLLTQVGLISYPPFSVKMRTTKTVSEKEEGSEVRDHCDLSHSCFQNFNAIGLISPNHALITLTIVLLLSHMTKVNQSNASFDKHYYIGH